MFYFKRYFGAAPHAEVIPRITGGFGRYQLALFLLISLSKIAIAFHQMAIIFLAPKASYKCPDTDTESCPCENPEFDRSVFKNTIIMQWLLICGKKWQANFSQSLFQLGTLLGSVGFGSASDWYGRRIPFIAAVIVQVVVGIATAFVPGFWLFAFLRFIIGLTVGGTMVVGFVIVMEFIGARYREEVLACYQLGFNCGFILLPVFGYFVRDYKSFQLTISVPTICLLSYICLIPETPRWFIAMKRTEEAITIITRVATVNKKPTENIRTDIEALQDYVARHELKKGTLIDLFRTSNLRKNIICMSLNWLACSYCFYGVSQYVGHISGDVFMNVIAGAIVTLFGTLASIPLLKLMGRRTILIVGNFICVACLIILAVLPEGIISVVCACIGMASSFIVFVLVYIYCGELFPTVVRNAAVGISSMMARVGSMIAPLVIEMRDIAIWMPPIGFAFFPFVGGCAAFFLPETKGCDLMTTLAEGEAFGKKPRT